MLFHFVLARLISVEEYGSVATLMALFMVLSVVGNSLGLLVVRDGALIASSDGINAFHFYVTSLLTRIKGKSWMICLFACTLYPLVAAFFSKLSMLSLVFAEMAAVIFIVFSIFNGALQAGKQFVYMIAAGLANSGSRLAFAVAIALIAPTVTWISFSLLLSGVASVVAAKFLYDRFVSNYSEVDANALSIIPSNSEKLNKRDLAYVFVFTFFMGLITNLDIIVVQHAGNAVEAGFYGAYSQIGKIVLWVNLSVVGVALPDMCATKDQSPENKRTRWLAVAIISLISISSLLFSALFPTFVVSILYGPKYVSQASILWIFLLMMGIFSMYVFELHRAYSNRNAGVFYALALPSFSLLLPQFVPFGSFSEYPIFFSAVFLGGYLIALYVNRPPIPLPEKAAPATEY